MPSVATTVARPRFSARLALMAGALAIVLAAATAPTAGAVDSFSATGSMANARSSPAWAVLPNGKVLVAGGFQNVSGTGSVLSSAELYDPQAGTWSTTGSLSTPRAGAAFAQLPDGKLLVAGGQSNVSGTPTTLASAEVYDPATGTFTATTGSMGTSRAGAKAVTMANGKVLVSGGTTNNGGNMMVAATSEIYDPATGNFTVTGTLSPNQISLFTLTLLDDGKVLAVGAEPMPAGTAKLSRRASRIAMRTVAADSRTRVRKVKTGSSASAIRNKGQFVPHIRVNVPSSASTLGETRDMQGTDDQA